MEKEKSLLEQHYGLIAFCGLCLLNPLLALIGYGYYRLFKCIGKSFLCIIEKTSLFIIKKIKQVK